MPEQIIQQTVIDHAPQNPIFFFVDRVFCGMLGICFSTLVFFTLPRFVKRDISCIVPVLDILGFV